MRKLFLFTVISLNCIFSYAQISDEEKVEVVKKWLLDNQIPLNTLHRVPQK
jgi:hypothetical protein